MKMMTDLVFVDGSLLNSWKSLTMLMNAKMSLNGDACADASYRGHDGESRNAFDDGDDAQDSRTIRYSGYLRLIMMNSLREVQPLRHLRLMSSGTWEP